jgi:amidase
MRPTDPISRHPLRRKASAFFCALVIGHCSLITSVGLRAAQFNLETATVADINAAFDKGALTSEKLTSLYLARIKAYNDAGPVIHAVIYANPKALEEAKALDAERKTKGPRSPLHGIPVVLKDNYDTKDMPTTAGSFLLDGSIPYEDSFITKKLRDAGAIILGKTNTSEFAYGGVGGKNGFSSHGGQTRNPHNLELGPGGSSGGSGAGIAANFALIGFGSDTGGSIRNPCSVNGIVGIKPTNGLLSRAGIVPLSLTFDTGGPMTRSVYDLAVSLGLTTGIDPKDPLTLTQAGLAYTDYTKFLDKNALKGARLGVIRQTTGVDPETARVFESALAELKAAGAILIEGPKLPDFVIKSRQELWVTIERADFKANIKTYLAGLRPGFPKDIHEMIKLGRAFTEPKGKNAPNMPRVDRFEEEASGAELTDQLYISAKEHGLAMITTAVMGLFEQYKVDALIYPTTPRPAAPIVPAPPPATPPPAPEWSTNIANFTGFPDVIVPAGVTKDKLPVTISFFGPAYSEPKLLGYAYAYEQANPHRIAPPTAPALPGESFSY